MKKNQYLSSIVWLVFILATMATGYTQSNVQNSKPTDAELLFAKLKDWAVLSSKATFEGEFVYQKQNQTLDVYSITQGIINDKKIHITSRINGLLEKSENDSSSVSSKPLQNMEVSSHHFLHQITNSDTESLKNKINETYALSSQGFFKVANRKTLLILIQPKDRLRYGYRFWFDIKSGIVLKADVFNPGTMKTIEHMQFTRLNILPNLENKKGQLHDIIQNQNANSNQYKISHSPKTYWKTGWLPRNFNLVEQGVQKNPFAQANNIEVNLYSDLLSVFTIFAQPLQDDKAVEFVYQIGMISGVSKKVTINEKSYLFVIIGAIPISTAQRVISSITQQN